MDFLEERKVGLVLVLFGNQGPSWSCRKNGKLVQSFVNGEKKEWLDFTLGVLIPSTIACFCCTLQCVPIKMYW
jgi:hypothetical protein